MKVLLVLPLILLAIALADIRASEIDVLIERVKKTTNTDDGISTEEQEIAKKLQAIGPDAIPYLLPLLHDPNRYARNLASYTLRDMNGLTEEHLDTLIDSCRHGDGWIPPAIARIGTAKAVDFLVDQLVHDRQTQTQLTYAVQLLGEKAFPRLLQVYETEDGWDDKLERTMEEVLHELGSKADAAIEPLLKIVDDENAHQQKKIHAMQALGSIGPTAQRTVPDLQKAEKDQDLKIRAAATAAIVRMGTAATAPILARRLEENKDPFSAGLILRDIASLHDRGKSAGPTVAKYLASKDWEVRVQATRTLGYIGYSDATDDLIKLLDCVEDWRVVLSAAEALGRLEAKPALSPLTKISQAYWYPPVREAALTAIIAIRDGVDAPSDDPEENFPSEFFSYENAGEDMAMLTKEEANLIKFPVVATLDQLPKSAIKTNPRKKAFGRQRGVKVDNGYLVGTDRGEWGGEITFFDLKGNTRVIVGANTEAIYKTAQGIFAVTGLAHLTMNGGLIYKVSKDAHGQWRAKEWRALPGAPQFSRLLKDGNLFVNCFGGITLVSPDGTMKLLTRAESLQSSLEPH